MRKAICRILAALALLATSGCDLVVASSPALVTTQWGAFIAQPVAPFVVFPGQPVVIIIELVPVNGFFLTGPVFFNDFFNANPSLGFACPGIIGFGTGTLGSFGNSGIPAVLLPISPRTPGFCNVPFNMGSNGTITIGITVQSSSAASRHPSVKPPNEPARNIDLIR